MKFTPNENVLRVALIVFSVIFGILSAALITLGVIYVDELYWPRRFIGLDFLALPTLVLLLGCCSLILSIYGCICAKSYNVKVFNIFIVFLVAILCMELTIAIICFENKNGLKDTEIDALKKDLKPAGKYNQIEDHVPTFS